MGIKDKSHRGNFTTSLLYNDLKIKNPISRALHAENIFFH